MMKVTIHVDDNYLGQVLESAEMRAQEIESGEEYDLKAKDDAAFIRKAIRHVQAARDAARRLT